MGAGLAVPARRSSLVRLPPVPGSAAAARAAVDDVLGGEGPPEIRFRVRLLATELVSNSVLHAGLGPEERLSLRLDLHDDRVRVEVTDEGRWRPGQATDDSVNDTPSGRGLLLVGALADRWGIVKNGTTKVWFEIDLQPSWPTRASMDA